ARPAGARARRAAPLRRGEGLDRGGRRQPDRRRRARRRVHRRGHPPHRRGHHARAQGPGRPGQPRGRRHREVRRTPAHLAHRRGRRRLDGGVLMPYAKVEDAIAAIGRGEIVIVVDDEDRENEGDLIMAAEFATPEAIAFFLHHTSGVICAPITAERARALDLPPMVVNNTAAMRSAVTAGVAYRHGPTTGISPPAPAAHLRAPGRPATAIRALVDPATRPSDLLRPGHIFPLAARDGGVLVRAGHTEAAVDLARMAGLYPAGVLCELVNETKDDMARGEEIERFAEEHGLLLISIADLVRYRRQTEKLVKRVAEARIPTKWGDFTAYAYESVLDGRQHVAFRSE